MICFIALTWDLGNVIGSPLIMPLATIAYMVLTVHFGQIKHAKRII